MMVIYDPNPSYTLGGRRIGPDPMKPWHRSYFDGCFLDRKDTPSKSTWVVPGTWPDWTL
jgi:hypothetical protein